MPTDDELIAAYLATKGARRLPKSASADIDWRRQIKRHHTEGPAVTFSDPNPRPSMPRVAAVDHAGREWYVNESGEVLGHS